MRNALFLLCLCIAAFSAFAQEKLSVRNLSVSFGNVRTITQDKEGFIWLGVADGRVNLIKYNGSNLLSYGYNQDDPKALSNNNIRNIYIDSSGLIWIGTYKGLEVFNPVTQVFTHIIHDPENPNSLLNDSIVCLVGDKNGEIWMGTTRGISRYNPHTGNFTNYLPDPKQSGSLSHRWVYSLLIDQNNDVWAGTFGGLNFFDRKEEKFISYRSSDGIGLTSDTITALSVDEKGNIWLGGLRNALHMYDRKSQRFTYFPPAMSGNKIAPPPDYQFGLSYINFIFNDSKNRIWIGTNFSGVSMYDPKTKKLSFFKSAIIENQQVLVLRDQFGSFNEYFIHTMYEADDGTLFLGASGGTIYLYSSEKEKLPYKVLNTIAVNTFCEDEKGGLWIGLQEGLLYQSPDGKEKMYKHHPKNPNSLSNDIVNSIRRDREGNLWIGTGYGVDRLNPNIGEFKHYVLNPPSDTTTRRFSNVISIMHIDEDDILWAASEYGLGRIDTKSGALKVFYREPGDSNSLANNDVYTVTGKGDTLWVGTYRGLDLYHKKNDTWKHYLEEYSIHALYIDSRGVLWVGTNMGVFRYDPAADVFKIYKDENTGISIELALGILEDDDGYVWISGLNNIYRISPDLEEIRVLGAANGVKLNGLFLADNYRLKDGRLIMGDESGYYLFHPRDYSFNTPPPRFYLADLKVGEENLSDNQSYARNEFAGLSDEVRLKSAQNSFSFEFRPIHFIPGETISFRYWLENYSHEWQDIGTNNKAYFLNLSPGEYLLKVRAVSSTGAWSEKMLKVIIESPWWQTWWGILLLTLSALLIISLITYIRSRQLRRQNKLLEDKVNYRTQQLKTSLENLKAAQAQLIQSEKMASLGELTAGIAHEIQNPLNFINNFSDLNIELLQEMQEEIDKGNLQEVKEIAQNIQSNEEKIHHHGKRADGIVKSMLQHSRINVNAKKEPTDVNKLVDEYFRLAYHGLRAKDKSFNAAMHADFEENLPLIDAIPQDIGRVILNMVTNAFHAVREKAKAQGQDYKPAVTLKTKRAGDKIAIIVSDNGMGIPENIREKIFQPFFTTKPAGQGTGLGLSLSYEIVTNAHGGELKMDSVEGEGTTFTIVLPINSQAHENSGS